MNSDPYQHCRDITKQRAKNFYWGIATLPSNQRKAVYSVYAFARLCDDIADSQKSLGQKKKLLNRERERIENLFSGTPPKPLYKALATTITSYNIPQQYFLELIRGVEMDLTVNRYQTFDDLYQYCYRVASVVGLTLIEIFGYENNQAKRRAIHLGVGMQITNIIRDVAEDFDRDRVYIPQEELKKFGCQEQNFTEQQPDQNLTELFQFQARRAREYFESGRKLFPYLPRRTRPCPAGLYGIYSRLLDKMESSNWNILNQRFTLNLASKLSAVGKQCILTTLTS